MLISEELPRVCRLLKQFKFCDQSLPVYATSNRIYIKKTGNHHSSHLLTSVDIKDMVERIGIPPQMPTEDLLTFITRIDNEIVKGNTLHPKLNIPEKIIRFAIWVSEYVEYEASTIMEGVYQQSIILGVDEACKLYLNLMPREQAENFTHRYEKELTKMQILN